MSAKTGFARFRGSGVPGFGVRGFGVRAGSGFGSGGFGPGVGVGVNRSRNRSSRNFGVRASRSTRASWPVSVRWRVSNSRYVPSRLHAIEFANTLARKLTGRGGAPPATGTSSTLVNAFVPIAKNAIHRPSGDQTGFGSIDRVGERAGGERRDRLLRSRRRGRAARAGCAETRCDLPSGENTGERSVAVPDVSARSTLVAKS